MGRWIAILAIPAVLIVAVLMWSSLRSRDTAPEPTADLQSRPPDLVPTPAPAPGPPVEEPIVLPAVDTSDAFTRGMIATLSRHPQFARWLVTDELVRRFVATIADLAQGSSPMPHLRFMAPAEPFAVRESAGRTVIDPAGYRRYDRVAEVFESLDTQGTARLIRRMQPLFEEAHRELGLSDRSFGDDLARAFANLLAVNVADRPVAVVRDESLWIYEEPGLERRSSAAKHLMRMGPRNAQRVQAKLAELAAALGIDVG